jgi:N-acetylmuramoyl-L-alanine amidase
VTSLVFDLHGNKMDMIKSISSELEKVGYEDLGVLVTPEYIILGRTVIPSLLLQVGFIDNENDNMIFDTRFNEVAQAIADGILTTLGESNKAIPALYRVQVGVFNQRENAEALLKSLHNQGYPAFLVEEDGSYKVQVGAYAELENAAKMEAFLRSQGYSTYITT